MDNEAYCDGKAIRKALISELSSDGDYEEIAKNTNEPLVHEAIDEIRADEQNHIGKLLGLLMWFEGGEQSSFFRQITAGLENKEVKG